MKYAHLSDLHIGSWRDKRMRDISTDVFVSAMNMCVNEQVDFILFAGDLFNTALPAVDKLAIVARKLKEVKDKQIPVYVIPGSHDFSASGKTMIDVLESAGLLINVYKGEVVNKKLRLRFTIDQKTGAKITGMVGKKGMLDRLFYDDLDRDYLEKEQGYKIFMFHTTLSQLKPKHLDQMESQPVTLLPRGFDYYAGGHVHHRMEFSSVDYKKVTQPGALFPNNFAELEKYSNGGFFIIEDDSVTYKDVRIKEHVALKIDCNEKNPEEIYDLGISLLDAHNIGNSLVTIRFFGTLSSGKVSDIRFKDIFAHGYFKGAYFIIKNTSKLQSKDFKEVTIQHDSIEHIEENLIKEHVQELDSDKEKGMIMTKELIRALSIEKKDGETTRTFEERLEKEVTTLLQIN